MTAYALSGPAVTLKAPRAATWGTLHGFALDCMRFAQTLGPFDTMTIVDSDQLALRAGYSAVIARHLHGQSGLGMLVNSPGVQPRTTRVAPAVAAWREVDRWRPWLRRFPDGEAKWVHWSFWPSTVFTSDACHALVDLFDHDDELRAILAASKLWATEEILFSSSCAIAFATRRRNSPRRFAGRMSTGCIPCRGGMTTRCAIRCVSDSTIITRRGP